MLTTLCTVSCNLKAVFPLLGGWACWKEERRGWFGCCSAWKPPESFGSSCNGITCPGEGAWSSHLGAPQPRRQWLRHAVPLDVVWGSGTAWVENSRGALLLPSVCSSLSPGLCPSCCCVDADICLLILPARVCTTSTGSAPAFSTWLYQSLGFAPGLCLTTGPCPGHLIVSFPHAGVDASIFGSRQSLRSSLGNLLLLKVMWLYLDVAVLWIVHTAGQLMRLSLPFFQQQLISGGHSIDCCVSSALFPF